VVGVSWAGTGPVRRTTGDKRSKTVSSPRVLGARVPKKDHEEMFFMNWAIAFLLDDVCRHPIIFFRNIPPKKNFFIPEDSIVILDLVFTGFYSISGHSPGGSNHWKRHLAPRNY
jgi:hypothetical protein